MKKGVLMFYINFVPDSGVTVEATIDLFRNQNKELLDKFKNEGNYEICFVPTVKEATRVEKIDFDMPFPRFLANASRVETDEDREE
jgi:hypothetical protein